MANQYQNIVVIGCGTIAYDVLRYCHETVADCTLSYIEYAAFPFNAATAYANKQGLPCVAAKDNASVREHLKNISSPTLIISANNTYLFPKDLVKKQNLTIINFHNALLPRYRGLNAASWVIYHQESQAGITWHYVSTGIDEGEIIIQKRCDIPENITAGELAGILMRLGTAAFKEILSDILQGTIKSYPQEKCSHGKLFKSYDVPNGGVFSLSDNVDDIYRLLRSVDYGPIRIFPYLCTQYQGKKISITEYQLCKDANIPQENQLSLPYGEKMRLCMKFRFVEANGQDHAI